MYDDVLLLNFSRILVAQDQEFHAHDPQPETRLAILGTKNAAEVFLVV